MAENTENWTKLESDSRYPRKYEFEELEQVVSNLQQLDFVDYKGTVDNYAELSGLTGLENGDAYVNAEDGLVYVWNGIEFPADGDGMDVSMKPIGVVEEGNEFAVSGGEVFEKTIMNNRIINYNFIDKIIAGAIHSSGVLSPTTNTLSVYMLPIEDYEIEIGGFVAGGTKNLRFYDADENPIGSNYTLGTLPFSITPIANAKFVSFTIKSVSDEIPLNPYIIYKDNEDSIITKQYFDLNAISKNDLKGLDLTSINEPLQLFDKNSMVVNGRAIGSNGNSNILSSAGHTDFIKIKPNSSIYVRKVLGSPTSGAWYDIDFNFISMFTMSSGNGFLSSPANAAYMRCNIYNSSTPNINDNIDAFMITLSTEEVDYKPFILYLGGIKDFNIYMPNEYDNDINNELSDYLLPIANYNYKKTLINNGDTNTLINIGIFGDSWTDRVPNAIYYVKDLTIILREKYGFGGAGWYDFAMSQGDGTSQKMGCANNEDATDVRTGTINYIDQNASALGINIAHPIFRDGSSITLNVLKPHQTARIYYYGGASYGSFSYQVGSGAVSNIDTSISSGLQFIDVVLNDVNESIYFTITGDVILFGVDLKRDYGVRIHKFGNRGLRAYNYTDVDRNNYIEWLESFDLDSSTLLIGTNDRTVGRTPTQFKEDLLYFKDLYFEALPYSELVMISPSNNEITSSAYPMSEFAGVMRDLCVENNLSFVNTIPLFGSSEKIIHQGTFYDNVHPTINGGRMIANYLFKKLFK